jgi:hypothetical protein
MIQDVRQSNTLAYGSLLHAVADRAIIPIRRSIEPRATLDGLSSQPGVALFGGE